ncbi:MAG: polyhydroxyalkanoate synthesis repressor PhaR [Hyphomicrobiales bacterium]|nr:polyhydroxyalkanoate synthesis repressor PhaR [Hyphomicrobiales bacterium]
MSGQSSKDARQEEQPSKITIKKYANRRLYNTATSCYVTLDYLSQLVKAGADFTVYDAKSGADITRSVLTHIIVEEESKGQSLLPVSFLRHLISFYGDSLQAVVPRYLDQSMQMFALNQQQIRDSLRDTFDGLMPFSSFEEMSKQQLAMFERTLRVFNPFVIDQTPAGQDEEAQATGESEIQELRSRLNSMQRQLDELIAEKADN